MIINRILGKVESSLYKRYINILKTIYVNFRLLRFHDAIYFPIYIYGPTKIASLKGNVIFDCDVKRGMIKIGSFSNIYSQRHPTTFCLSENSKMIFAGYFKSADGCIFHLKNKATLRLGAYTTFGDNVRVVCSNHIEVGDYTQITFDSILSDSNCHYMIDFSNMTIKNRNGEILLGKRNWIGNNSRINKGTKTGDGCIIASGSMTNKSYAGNNIVIAGAPAKVVKENVTRVLSFEREREVEALFIDTRRDFIVYDREYTDPYNDIIDFFR